MMALISLSIAGLLIKNVSPNPVAQLLFVADFSC